MLRRQALRAGQSLRSLRISSSLISRHLASAAPGTDIFANGTNAYYAEEMYKRWRHDPKSVHSSWDVYFSGLDRGLPGRDAFQAPPALVVRPADGATQLHGLGGQELNDHLKVWCVFIQVLRFVVIIILRKGPIACSSLPSSWSPRCRTRSFGDLRC